MVVVSLLVLYFVAGSCSAILSMMFNECLVVHGKALERGKYLVPKRWFSSFYLCALILIIILSSNRIQPMLLFLGIHVYRRFFETLLIMPYSDDSKMHITHLLMGYTFYMAVTLAYFSQPINRISSQWVAIFLILNGLQMDAHFVLGTLRKDSSSHSKIPRVRMFKYMLCPHYLIEILLYVHFCSLSPNILTLSCLLFVTTNLAISSRLTAVWHKRKFGEDDRFALIPHFL